MENIANKEEETKEESAEELVEKSEGEGKPKQDNPEDKLGKLHEKQARRIILIGIVIIVSFAFVFFLFNASKSFEYGGMDFKKTRFGSLELYETNLDKRGITGEVIGSYNLYLRNDPRTLEYIPIEDTKLELTRIMYVTIDEESNSCPYGAVSINPLSNLLQNSNVLVQAASLDAEYGAFKSLPQITCANATDSEFVLAIKRGEENKIYEEQKNCYVIESTDCAEMRKVIERYLVGVLAHSIGKEI